jgi:hypothetical protein
MNSFLDSKIFIAEAIKDSPIFLYAAFYEPIHSWLYSLATEMNPIVEFLLNSLALCYGIYRVYRVFKRWKDGKESDKDNNNNADNSGSIQHALF